MATFHVMLLSMAVVSVCQEITMSITPSYDSDLLSRSSEAVTSVLKAISEDNCVTMVLTDGHTSQSSMFKMDVFRSSWGSGVFEVPLNHEDTNATRSQFSSTIRHARKLRQLSWCVIVVVVSDDPAFLTTFAEWSLKGRLLVWSTRLLVLTTLPREDLRDLLTDHWTFSMNNAMLINVDYSAKLMRCGMFAHLPYSPEGGRVVQVALWTNATGLQYLVPLTLFPEKYNNFHGTTINVTVLTYEPYWKTAVEGNTTRHSGMDHNQLAAIGKALNFSFRVLPSRDWTHVTDQVESRQSFITCVMYGVLPKRLEKWDYTFIFDESGIYFAMATPVFTPSWLGFYYPFTDEVWVAVLASTILVCFLLVRITQSAMWKKRHGELNAEAVVMETVGSLLGQGLYGRLSTYQSNHILVASWLMFGVVVGTSYRSSLIASLTLPRLPPRPETIEELVTAVDRVTMESYGSSYKTFFSTSDSSTYRTLGGLMYLGGTLEGGLNGVLTMKRAHIGGLLNLQLTATQLFARLDRTSPIYVGKQSMLKILLAWPIPHDAPYKPALDRNLRYISQAGLYAYWKKRVLEDTARERRIKRREQLKQQPQLEIPTGSQRSRSLTIIHIQGPLLLLLVGFILGGVAFGVEICWGSSA